MPKTVKYAPEYVKQALFGKDDAPDLNALVMHFFDIAGGPRAVAHMFHRELTAEGTTTFTKAKILDLLLWGTKVASDQRPPPTDLGLVTEDDLIAEWQHVERKLSGGKEAANPEPFESDGSGI
jgi:hypothetical protein